MPIVCGSHIPEKSVTHNVLTQITLCSPPGHSTVLGILP